MRLKAGTRIVGLRPEALLGMVIADGAYQHVTGEEMVVTEIVPTITHKRASLHNVGFAWDARIPDGTQHAMVTDLVQECRRRLNGTEAPHAVAFDVVDEHAATGGPHIHFEFQPK